MSPIRALLAAFATVVILAMNPAAHAQAPAMPMGAGAMPQVQLSEQSAKNAIDAYLALKKMFGGDKMAAITGPGSAIAGVAASRSFQATIRSYGFRNASEWQRILTSFIMTHSLVRDGKIAEFDRNIAAMQNNPNVPKNVLEMMKSMRPSANNIKVMKAVAADPAYAAKIAQARK